MKHRKNWILLPVTAVLAAVLWLWLRRKQK